MQTDGELPRPYASSPESGGSRQILRGTTGKTGNQISDQQDAEVAPPQVSPATP